MSPLSSWLETAQEVVRNPAEFFSYEDRRSGFDYPLRFAFISLLISAVIGAVGVLIAGVGQAAVEGGIAAALSTLIGGPIIGLIALFIGSAFIHLFVYFLGGNNGYNRTFAVLAYATALSPIAALVGLIPFIGGLLSLLIALYGLYIEIKGVEIFQDMTMGRAAVSVILPGIILFAIVAALAIAAIGFLTMGGLMGA